jgi:phosphoenolpyruvate---glycerone phosphotransferase subunit DhaL
MRGQLRTAILAATDALESARDELSRLDAHAGDGDHGVTMTIAARAVRSSLDKLPPDCPDTELLLAVARAAGSVGGAMGPIYASALLRIVNTLQERQPEAATVTPVSRLRWCAQAAEASVTEFGGAMVGDKTVLDALHPVVVALRAAESAGLEVSETIAIAARAARVGADETAGLVARAGRASRLGERSRGVPDPGATSLAVMLEAAAQALVAPPTEEEVVRG